MGLPQRHLSHEREGESHVHVGLLPMGRQFAHRVLGPSAGSLDERAGYVCILRRVLCRRFRVGLCFRPGNEGFALGGDGQVVRRTTRGPRRVCSSNMLGFSVSVWLVCGWVSRVHRDMSWCHCLCVCLSVCVSLSLSVRLVRKEESRIKPSLSVSQHRGENCRREAASYHPLGKPCYSSNVGSMCLESMHKEEASDSHMVCVCVEGPWCVRLCVCLSLYVCVHVRLCTSVCLYLPHSLSVGMHMDLTLLHSSAIVSLVTELKCALDHSSNAFALAQDCHNIELHLSW